MSLLGDAASLTGWPQKIAIGGLGAGLLTAAAFNIAQAVENRHLASENAKLDSRINDPKTGYVVRLTQASTNGANCVATVSKAKADMAAQSSHDAALIADVQTRYDTEHAARVRAESAAAVLLAHKPQGATVIDRVLDVDAQILGDLK